MNLTKGTDQKDWLFEDEHKKLSIGRGTGRVNMDVVNKYVEEGLVKQREHENLPISIYKYKQNHSFTPAKRFLRGTVIADNGMVIARPFEKFFNHGEWNKELDEYPPEEEPTIMEKEDGSMISMFYYQGQWCVASSSEFDSPHAEKARELAEDLNKDHMKKKYTYVFEMVSSDPDFQIVKQYDEDELLLLAVRHRVEGEYGPVNLQDIASLIGTRTPKIHDMTLKEAEDGVEELSGDREGFVLWWPKNNLRAKLKASEYVEQHKVLTSHTPDEVYVANQLDQDGEVVDVDEEKFEEEIKEVEKLYQELWSGVEDAYGKAKEKENRKQAAQYLQRYRDGYEEHAVYALLDGNQEQAHGIVVDQVKEETE